MVGLPFDLGVNHALQVLHVSEGVTHVPGLYTYKGGGWRMACRRFSLPFVRGGQVG